MIVGWYGGGSRRVEAITGRSHWCKGGKGLVLILWAFVCGREGTHRDEYFYTTELGLGTREIIIY